MNEFFSNNNQSASENALINNQQGQQAVAEQGTADVIEMFKNVREVPDTTVGWGKEKIPGKMVDLNVDVGTKLKTWLVKHPNVKLKIKKLRSATKYGATHCCEFVQEDTFPPENVDHLNKILTVAKGRSTIDGAVFSVSRETIAPYLVKFKGRIGLRLTIAVRDGDIVVVGE